MTITWWVVSLLACGLFVWGTWHTDKLATTEAKGKRFELPVILVGGLLIRLALAGTTKGYPADIATFSAWADHASEGLTSFYSPGYFADYPPGYIYVLWLVGTLRKVFNLGFDSPYFLAILKFPAILSDLVTVWLLHRLARKNLPKAATTAVAALYAFNPAVILDSAVWGQVDSVLTIFILLGALLLPERPGASGIAFAVALLAKPQALIFAPLPLLWFASQIYSRRDRQTVGDLFVFTGAAILVFCAGILPFAAGQPPAWIVEKYGGTLASYPYATLNAYNLFALTGANTLATTDKFLFLPYGTWGTIFIVCIVLFVSLAAFLGRDETRFPYIPLFLSASVFVLSAKMHERYLFPALALSLAFYIASRDRRGLLLHAGFTVTQFFNVAQVLALSHREIYGIPRFDPLLLAGSLANVLLWLLLVKTGWDRYLSERQQT